MSRSLHYSTREKEETRTQTAEGDSARSREMSTRILFPPLPQCGLVLLGLEILSEFLSTRT